MFATKQNHDGY